MGSFILSHLTTLSWTPYRVSIRQYDPVFKTFSEIGVAFHFDENPNGEAFRFGPQTSACTICPSYVVIEPMTFELFLDTATGTFEYEYSSIGAPLQWADSFAFSQN